MTNKWDAILRCQTWHVWPEFFGGELSGVPVNYGADSPLLVNIAIQTYQQRSDPVRFVPEPSQEGPPLPSSELVGLHRVGDWFLKAPEDVVELSHPPMRLARRGELDIIFDFEFDGDSLPKALTEALRDTAHEMMALLNVRLRDFLTPKLPFEVRLLPGDGNAQIKTVRTLTIQARSELLEDDLRQPLMDLVHFLTDSTISQKYRTALELYAAHFNERQPRVRFILLVIAMEALAEPSPKDPIAQDLLDRWEGELKEEKSKHDKDSEAYHSLQALSQELSFRRGDSIGNTVRKLFVDLPNFTNEECAALQRRAVKMYNRRSTLIHEGYVPPEELRTLELGARTLVEILFRAAITRSQPAEARVTVVDVNGVE